MSSIFVLRAHVRVGFEPKKENAIPGCIQTTFRKCFQCAEDEHPAFSVSKQTDLDLSDIPLDGLPHRDTKENGNSTKECSKESTGRNNTARQSSNSFACGSTGDDDGDEDEDKDHRNRKGKELEDALPWSLPDNDDLQDLQSLIEDYVERAILFSNQFGAITSSLLQLMHLLQFDPRLTGLSDRRRSLRRFVCQAVRMIFLRQSTADDTCGGPDRLYLHTQDLDRIRLPELSRRLMSLDPGNQSRCYVVDIPQGTSGNYRLTPTSRGPPSLLCCFPMTEESETQFESSITQRPSSSSSETCVTYGETQDLDPPVSCTDPSYGETGAPSRNDATGIDTQLIPPVTLTFQLRLRGTTSVYTAPCEEENQEEAATIDIRRALFEPARTEARETSGRNGEIESATGSGAASSPWVDQLEQHAPRAAYDVQSGIPRFPVQATEVCDHCNQRDLWVSLNPCKHRLCSICEDDAYPPVSQQAVVNPRLTCPVCHAEVKHIECLSLYPQ